MPKRSKVLKVVSVVLGGGCSYGERCAQLWIFIFTWKPLVCWERDKHLILKAARRGGFVQFPFPAELQPVSALLITCQASAISSLKSACVRT